jgi:hypothetical protein
VYKRQGPAEPAGIGCLRKSLESTAQDADNDYAEDSAPPFAPRDETSEPVGNLGRDWICARLTTSLAQ